VLSCCQEISRNVDTVAITPARSMPKPSYVDKARAYYQAATKQWTGLADPTLQFFERRMNIKGNTGSKGFGSNGMKRMLQFCNWAFTDPAAQEADTIIVTGHSLWFRTFFQTFLCGSENHFACKKSKMKNAGVVTFNLIRISPEDAGEPKYMIEPNSLQSVFPTEDAGGAFERSK